MAVVRNPKDRAGLFGGGPDLPPGMKYAPEFIGLNEEKELLREIGNLILAEAQYRQYTARRRIVSYGGSYDFSAHKLKPAEPIPIFLLGLRDRIASWAAIPSQDFVHALIAEYSIGTQVGWHRDVPDFEVICGISLAGWGRMSMRRYPPNQAGPKTTLALELSPRSAYCLRDEARWGWQHCIRPVKEVRYSITFRTGNSSRR